ncbi:hypothetical protein [Rummeliibacillus stabekisii]|uniref:hypothetical protein n=1 Tax=Rummeliibacillus stabekisii TaxID=241244 RepID=UPI00371FEF72
MKKLAISILVALLFVVIVEQNASATTLQAKDYIPNTKNTYIYKVKGFYINSYKTNYKQQYKNGYWYMYDYDTNIKKTLGNYIEKDKYVIKKDGLYTVGKQVQYDTDVDIKQKLLPLTFKKGTSFKSTFTSNGMIFTQNSKVVSTTGKLKIANKPYKNVVKVSSTSSTNKKEKSISYYIKGMGKVKSFWNNGESRVTKNKGTTTISEVIKR